MIDMVLKNKAGISYAKKLTIFIIIYGVSGYVNNVHTSVWDRLFEVTNNTIKFEAAIDMNKLDITNVDNLSINKLLNMNSKVIKNLGNGVESADSVNIGQLNEMESIIGNYIKKEFAKVDTNLKDLINEKRYGYYYHLFNKYFFDCLDPNMFNVNPTAYGSQVININNKMTLGASKGLSNFNISNGFSTYGGKILLDEYYTNNSDFTMFIVFKHDSSITNASLLGFEYANDYQYPFIGFNEQSFYMKISNNGISMKSIYGYYTFSIYTHSQYGISDNIPISAVSHTYWHRSQRTLGHNHNHKLNHNLHMYSYRL